MCQQLSEARLVTIQVLYNTGMDNRTANGGGIRAGGLINSVPQQYVLLTFFV